MSYRLLIRARRTIDDILVESARTWGEAAAERYDRLLLAAFAHLGDHPLTPGSDAIRGLSGWRSYHLRLARTLVEPHKRVGHPRHVVIYRTAADEVTEIAGLVHDRMLLVRVARYMLRPSPFTAP